MKCPICNSIFTSYEINLEVGNQAIYFCSEECLSKAKKVLTYNSSRLSIRRIRQLLKEVYQSNNTETKVKIKKAKEETPKTKLKINSFAYRLFMERLLADYSIADLSEKSGISEGIIKHLEAGDYQPTDFVANKLCKALGKKLGRK